jgi:alpha-glucosidase
MNKTMQNVQFSKCVSKHEWWRGATIYQIYPRSFYDSNNDGIGDLIGITQKLDYIASLGVDAIWISPFFTSPMKDFGYDVADFCGIDPMFGTIDDFKKLLHKAHNLGLKIIIDQVYSHTSEEHIWFKQSREDKNNDYADYYVWANPKPDGSPPNNWQSVFHGASWEWDARRNQYYFHNFLPEQPDLNLHNPKVQEEIIQVAKFWLELGVDGFRLDALNFAMHDEQLRDNPVNPREGLRTRPFDYQDHIYNMSHPAIPQFLERLSKTINSYEQRFTVAEVGGELALAEMKEFTKGDKRLNTAYGFKFLYAPQLSKELVIAALSEWNNVGFDEWPSYAFSNHDAPRAITRWANGRDLGDMARFCTSLLTSLRGNIFIYQGEELGLEQADVPFERLVDPEAIKNWPKTLGRDGARTPMIWEDNANGGFGGQNPWLPIDNRHFAKAVANQEEDANSILNFTRNVLQIRQVNPCLLWGSLEIVATDAEILHLIRQYDGEIVHCIFNFGQNTISLPQEVKIENIIHSANMQSTIIDESGKNISQIPPLGALIYR